MSFLTNPLNQNFHFNLKYNEHHKDINKDNKNLHPIYTLRLQPTDAMLAPNCRLLSEPSTLSPFQWLFRRRLNLKKAPQVALNKNDLEICGLTRTSKNGAKKSHFWQCLAIKRNKSAAATALLISDKKKSSVLKGRCLPTASTATWNDVYCKGCDNCRCLDCQSGYFDCEEDSDAEEDEEQLSDLNSDLDTDSTDSENFLIWMKDNNNNEQLNSPILSN